MKTLTLEEIIKNERAHRVEDGMFGIAACKRSIEFYRDTLHESLFTQLEGYLKRANEDAFFNKAMILACWEMINGQ